MVCPITNAADGGTLIKTRRERRPCLHVTGLDSMGIYRLSGTTSRVQALKAALDKGEHQAPSALFLLGQPPLLEAGMELR
jgi:hypothetical protein